MNDLLTPAQAVALILAVSAGAALGAMFYGSLWWTTRRGAASPQPALWFLGGLLLRMGLALAGFYVVASGRWDRMLACLLGFVAARVLITWLLRAPGEDRNATQP